MKHKVTIDIEIDPIEYFGVTDNDLGAIVCAIAILEGDADLPQGKEIIFSCEGTVFKKYLKTIHGTVINRK